MRYLSLFFTLLLIVSPLDVFSAEREVIPEPDVNQRVLLVNGAIALTLLGWGYLNWDYGDRSAHMESEGWFGYDTEEGGADKFGHMYTGYVLTHGSATLYRKWGCSRERASLLGAGTSLMMTGLVEIGDSFSNYGFSPEDMVANILGAALGYTLYRYPDVQKKIDFRWEFNPDFNDWKGDFVTDYEHSKFLFAVKAEGFESIQNKWLRALELHVGYYARNYEDYDPLGPDHRERFVYVGIGLNVGRLIRDFSRTRLFNYMQLPYTYVEMRHELEH